jgi:uncharacterized alpha-E superfamily protein
MKTTIKTLLGLNDQQTEEVKELLEAAGVTDLQKYLQEVETATGKAMLDSILVSHHFPYRTLRLVKEKNSRGEQIRNLISQMTSQQLATTCDQAERYGVNDATDWMRWAELNGLRVNWAR